MKLLKKYINKVKKRVFKKKNKLPDDIRKFIPPFEKNYTAHDKKRYEKFYLHKYTNYILPECFKRLNYDFSTFPKILDLGCGFAPMCLAAKIFRDNANLNKDDVQYIGIDIREDAIDFNKSIYKEHKNILFVHHKANDYVDYVGKFTRGGPKIQKTKSISDGSECDYKIPAQFKADIQWSGSLFTHLTYNAVKKNLEFISNHLNNNGISINTWHIIDPESLYSLQLGIADRKLEYDMNEFLTYDKENPLRSTVYKLEYIQKAYTEAGLKIEEIIHGLWRGNKSNQLNSHQDIIIAKKS